MAYSKNKSSDFQNTLFKDWEIFTINKLIDNKKELFDYGDWIEAEYLTDEGIRLVQTGNIGEGEFIDKEKKKYISEESYKKLKCKELLVGDILICRLADPAGRACVLPNIGEIKMITSVDISIFRPNNGMVDRNFLVATFSTSNWFNEVRIKCGGSTRTRIARSKLGNIKFSLPPLPEQKAIAHVLGLMDTAINKNNQLIAKKELRKKWLMQNLLTGKKRSNGYENLKWKTKLLKEILIPISRPVSKPTVSFLALGIRSHGKGTFLKYDFEPTKIEMDTLFVVRENDLIVNITFAWEGAIAIVKKEDDGALVSHRFPTFTFNPETGIVDYFRHFILQPRFKYLLGLISPGGAGRNRVLDKKDFLKLEVKVPSIEEQTAIAKVLQAADKEIQLLKTKTEKLKEQKKGLMQILLTGKKRLKVN